MVDLVPVLVLGIGRSGTTLMMQILGTSPRIAFDRIYPFETRLLAYLHHWSSLLDTGRHGVEGTGGWDAAAVVQPPSSMVGTMPYTESRYWDGPLMRRESLLAAWTAFSRVVADRAGDPSTSPVYYAEKTPFWLPRMCWGSIPYRGVLLVRDPRDVFRSVRAFDAKRGYAGFGFSGRTGETEQDHARRFIEICRPRLQIIRGEVAATTNILVRYEDVITDLAGQTDRLGRFLGVGLDAPAVQRDTSKYGHHSTSTSFEASVGGWREALEVSTCEILNRGFVDELRYFGYEADGG